MGNTQISIDDARVQRLQELATSRRVPMDQLVQQAIDTLLDQPPAARREELWERSLALIGAAHTGISDLARNHDKYLAEDFC